MHGGYEFEWILVPSAFQGIYSLHRAFFENNISDACHF
jgi:hypothetical protein